MTDTYPNPWDFHNTDKTLLSSDLNHKVVYYDLNEIAMGGPLGGLCFLETTENKKIKINDWCGGPAIWETSGFFMAVPIWTRNALQGTVQQIGLLNLRTNELKIYSTIFRVLDFRFFDKNIISGYDSPIYQTKTLTFNIDTEKVDQVVRL